MGLLSFFKKTKEEKEVEKWLNREKPKFKTLNSESIHSIETEYDLNNIRGIGIKEITWWYLLENSNKDIAIKDILSLNRYLSEYNKGNTELSKIHLHENLIRFYEYEEATENDDFTKLIINPYTDRGNLKKYPIILKFTTFSNDESFKSNFNNKPNIFGEIHYLKTGKIDKYKIVIWINDNMHEIKGNYN